MKEEELDFVELRAGPLMYQRFIGADGSEARLVWVINQEHSSYTCGRVSTTIRTMWTGTCWMIILNVDREHR